MTTTPPTEPTEGMTLAQFQAARQVLRDAVAKFDKPPTCHNCSRFEMGGCKLHGEVPAEFQKQPEACGDWVYDAIPF